MTFSFQKSLALLASVISVGWQASPRLSSLPSIFFSSDVGLQGELEVYLLCLFYHESADSVLSPRQLSCLRSCSRACLTLRFSLRARTHLCCRRTLSLNWTKSSHAEPWVESLSSASGGVHLPWQGFAQPWRHGWWQAVRSAASDPGSAYPRRRSPELSRSQDKLIQRMEEEVWAIIIPGPWRGCCQKPCTGGCPSCYLRLWGRMVTGVRSAGDRAC